MKLKDVAEKLTWHPLEQHGLYPSDFKLIEGFQDKFGILVKTKDGEIHEIGDYIMSSCANRLSFYDGGCGCCSDNLQDCVSIAFLSEYIEELKK